MELCTVEQVRAHLEIPDTGSDNIIELFITSASKEIEDYLDRGIEIQSDYLEDFDVGKGVYTFWVKYFPITTMTSIWNDSFRTFDSSSLIDSDNYYVDTETGRVVIDRKILSVGYGTLRMKYDGGMASSTDAFIDTFPDLSNACAMEVAYRYQRRGMLGAVNIASAGATLTVVEKRQFIGVVTEILDHYRRHYI